MWSYYGGKGRIVSKYPEPQHNTIVEPFAGSAKYSLHYWERDIILCDKYEVVCKLWKWLQQCSKQDILSIRQLSEGESVDDFQWCCEEEKWLIGFLIGAGDARPRKKASPWRTTGRPYYQKQQLSKIANNLHKIKHWKILHCGYDELPNIRATWFIDPPYQDGGHRYKFGNKHIDYNNLREFCLGRKGQVIVCERNTASWMGFKPLTVSQGVRKTSIEAMCTFSN